MDSHGRVSCQFDVLCQTANGAAKEHTLQAQDVYGLQLKTKGRVNRRLTGSMLRCRRIASWLRITTLTNQTALYQAGTCRIKADSLQQSKPERN
jgi:hypothetical protein